MKNRSYLVLAFTFFLGAISMAYGMDNYEVPDNINKKRAISMLKNLKKDNDKFVKKHKKSYFEDFKNKQNPRTTLIMCVDSRCHHHAFDKSPDNDIFTVRNFSGQYSSNKGAVIYGVKNNNTPLLVIMGHDDCGAVTKKTQLEWLKTKLAGNNISENYKNKEINDFFLHLKEIGKIKEEQTKLPSNLEELKFIIDELEGVEILEASIPTSEGNNQIFNDIVHQNIKFNIHKQVDKCLEVFQDKVKNGELIIIGALYDFQNREAEGHGKLILIDARTKENIDDFIEGGKLKNSGVKAMKKTKLGEEIPNLPKDNETIEDNRTIEDNGTIDENGDIKYSNDPLFYVVNKSIKLALNNLKKQVSKL